MKPIDVIILVVAAVFVLGVVALSFRRKKQGKTGCGCDCGGCQGCSHQANCLTAKTAQNPETEHNPETEQTPETEHNPALSQEREEQKEE